MSFWTWAFFFFFFVWCFTFRWENTYVVWVSSMRFDNLGNFQDHFVPRCKNVGTLASTLLTKIIRWGCSQTIVVTWWFAQVVAEQWKRKPSGLFGEGVSPLACEYQGAWHSGGALGSKFPRGVDLSLASLVPPAGSFLNPLLPFSGPAGNWPFRADPWLIPSPTSPEGEEGKTKSARIETAN